ncbi:MAG TPA: tRNA dihydrouridine synthase DusB [Gammaproteobacteria bacterium]
MQIGQYTFPNSLVLAPMAGVTDAPFRRLCKKLGAGRTVSEMLTSKSELWDTAKSSCRMNFAGEDGIRTVQIAGADPVMMAEAARYCVDLGAHIIDINMGCPVKKVCNVMAGSALLKDESLVARILQAVVAAVTVPVTLKIRTGWGLSCKNGLSIAHIAADCGIRALAVHGRTREDGYKQAAEYETIHAIKQIVSIPVFANGDIDSPEKARQVLDLTGADGLLIGRAAQGNPWIFREIDYFLQTGRHRAKPSLAEIHNTVLEHLQDLHAFYGKEAGVRIARKHIGWYLKPQYPQFWQQINRVEEANQQYQVIDSFFRDINARAETASRLAA